MTYRIETLTDESRLLKSELGDFECIKQTYGAQISTIAETVIRQDQQRKKRKMDHNKKCVEVAAIRCDCKRSHTRNFVPVWPHFVLLCDSLEQFI